MLRLLVVLLALPVALLSASAGDNVIELDFFRAMQGSYVDDYTLENNDLASLVGSLKYVHTEVIAEHSVSPRTRPTRKYSIDVIARSTFRVKNPSRLLLPDNTTVQHVDFGQFVTFDVGVATNTVQQPEIQQYGSFVGVQDQRDVRFTYDEPYYWFSVSGFCPNLQWAQKGSLESPNPDCLRDTRGEVVMGGLCRNSSQGTQQPTGAPDCTYTYGNTSVVSLDELVNITGEDCGGRQCADWLDFRHNCSNAAYRWAFDPLSGNLTSFEYCVEYDISPACQADCDAAACLALPEDQREVGLPFWQGRCSSNRNAWRAEQLAAAYGIASATRQHKLTPMASEEAETCVYPGGMCHPSTLAGGMYCSRAWAGVCQPCWIPGTEQHYPASDQAICPYDVLQSQDYRNWPQGPPRCKSARPRDLCCLYLSPSSCDPSISAELPPLDEDGYALVAAQQNTSAMVAFLMRVAAARGAEVANAGGLERMAYWEWGRSPRRGRVLAMAEAAMAPFLKFPTSTSTTTTTSNATAAEAGMDGSASSTAAPRSALVVLVRTSAAALAVSRLWSW